MNMWTLLCFIIGIIVVLLYFVGKLSFNDTVILMLLDLLAIHVLPVWGNRT